MSIESTWDLRSASSPRSLCVYTPSAQDSTNPFQLSSPFDTHAAQAIVFGTERGSLHYRTYPPPRKNSRGTGLSSPGRSSTPSTSFSSRSKPQDALGINPSSGRSASNLPRSYFPVDLPNSTLHGIVTAVVRATPLNSSHGNPVFLLLVDDNRGTSAASPGAYAAHIVTLNGSFSHLSTTQAALPRMSCATYHARFGFVYAAGRKIASIAPEALEEDVKRSVGRVPKAPFKTQFTQSLLPAPGARSGQDALEVTSSGKVVVVAVGNSFYAVVGAESHHDKDEAPQEPSDGGDMLKILSFSQSSQVHPVIIMDIRDRSLDPDWSSLFLASGRDCAVVDLHYGPSTNPQINCSKARNGIVTLASPILSAASSWPWLAVLTSDGLVSIRSASCLAIALRTIEVGTRPNDYFILRTLPDDSQPLPWIMSISYSGEGKVLQCQPDTAQDLADRLMRLSIDAFGANGFPRAELADAVKSSFTATSYVGPEPTGNAQLLLRQYLEAVLGLSDFEGGGSPTWPTVHTQHVGATSAAHHGSFADDRNKGEKPTSGRGSPSTVVSSATPPALLTGTALLCLVCTFLSPPNSSLANRAAKACVEKIGVVVKANEISSAAVRVCELVASKLLEDLPHSFSLISGSSPKPISLESRKNHATVKMEFVEAAVWLLRACGEHERAIDVLRERVKQSHSLEPTGSTHGTWSNIKYDSYTATHLSELWGSGKEQACRLVLTSHATYHLLENNPRLGLSAFTALHPSNEDGWKSMIAKDDPLAHPLYPQKVVELLKSIKPVIPYERREAALDSAVPSHSDDALPLESGRAMAVTFLESAIGVGTSRPTDGDEFDSLAVDETFEERVANFHDELSFLLLEGVITERGDNNDDTCDTKIGKIYRMKLRRFLRWPACKIRSDAFLMALPKSFLQEQALVLGRLGRHEDAIRILYSELDSLELALEYCDHRHNRLQIKRTRDKLRQNAAVGTFFEDLAGSDGNFDGDKSDCAYLPLIRVALESDADKGPAAAIQVLALRRTAIDRAAALRLLPRDIPVSAIARPFLIPALVDSESQVRRLTVVSALLRARSMSLKHQLTNAQLKAQALLHAVPQLRSLKLGDPLHSTKPFRARPSSSASDTFPDVMIQKYFFSRYLVIQAKVTHYSEGQSLGDVTFVVAESSEEAIQPYLQVPLKVLPYKVQGSSWCVLSATPQRMDSLAILTCELRYTVWNVDSTGFAGGAAASSAVARNYVEELQDIEVYAAHFF